MPQSNSNLQSYAKLPAAKNNSPKIPQISQNISLRLSLMPLTDLTPQFCTPDAKSHRCFTHPCSLRLTQISQIPRFCTPGVKSHRCSPHPLSLRLTQISQISHSFARLALNLTEALRTLAPLGSHRFNEIQQK